MIEIQNLKLNVEINGSGNSSVILLHGWGQSTETFKTVSDYLQAKFTVYGIDLPGFGKSDKPNRPFNTEDYANILKGIIDYYRIDFPVIIGHSFGGRIAIKYTALYDNVDKLVLIDSAGIVSKKKLNYYVKVYAYKLVKKLFSLPVLKKYRGQILSKFGSSDYKNASDVMKDTLVKVVNEDLRDDLCDIVCPTLMIWGTEDQITPLNDAYIMKEYLYDAGIVKIEKAGHFSYLDNMDLFLRVVDVFLTDNKAVKEEIS